MIKELVKDEAILSTPCEKATAEDAQVAQDLLDTLASMETAACLAANQIGVSKCILVYKDDDEKPHAMFNPIMRQTLAPFKTTEGCLTKDGETKVTRFDRIRVVYDELEDGELKPRKGDFEGWTAELLQHMMDHCKGKYI